MPRSGKRWVPIDWNFFDDGYADDLTDAAMVLFQRILIDCHRRDTNGIVSTSSLRHLGRKGWQNSFRLLLRSGRISQKDDQTYYIPSWDKWHEPIDAIHARRAADRQRKRLKNGIPRGAFRIPD